MAFASRLGGPKCDEMQLLPDRPRVAGSALTTPHFLLLYAAMLVAAAGNTALQSVMPAIGREIGISDFWVTVSYTWSAVLWVALAPFWARQSDRHGRKALTLLGVGGFIASMTAVRPGAARRTEGRAGRRADLRRLRHLPRALRLARLGNAQRDPGLSRLAHPPLGAGRGAVGAVEQLQPGNDRRPGAGAVVRAAAASACPGPLFVFAAIAHRRVRRDPRRPARRLPSRATAGAAGMARR